MKTLFTSFIVLVCFTASAQTDNCCINPDWVNPDAMCTMEYDPVVGCNEVEYGNSCIAQISGVTSWTDQAGQTSSLDWDCETNQITCTSWSGVEIAEPGDWTNPDNPCDMGHCNEDGTFSGIIIDCAQPMGVECNGEWVEVEGQCCSECIETPVSDCGDISIQLNNGWNMIGFACANNTDASVAFAPIQDKIIIAKDGAGNAYLTDWNFNGLGHLKRGYGYLIKVSEEIPNYNICE